MNHIPKNIGQAYITAVVTISKFEMIQSKKMWNCSVKIINVHGIVDGIHPQIIGTTISETTFEPPPSIHRLDPYHKDVIIKFTPLV